jgi:hypothetical protein
MNFRMMQPGPDKSGRRTMQRAESNWPAEHYRNLRRRQGPPEPDRPELHYRNFRRMQLVLGTLELAPGRPEPEPDMSEQRKTRRAESSWPVGNYKSFRTTAPELDKPVLEPDSSRHCNWAWRPGSWVGKKKLADTIHRRNLPELIPNQREPE